MAHVCLSPHCPRRTPPYPPEIQARFDALMPPGVAPLVLFRTLARDQRLFHASWAAACSTRAT